MTIDVERAALEDAIRKVEREMRHWKNFTTKGSTVLLLASMYFAAALWAVDFTSMSLFWVARYLNKTIGPTPSGRHAQLPRVLAGER